jgi:hypothetical protein
MAVVGALLVACGDSPTVTGPSQAAGTSTTTTAALPAPTTTVTVAGHSYSGELTTTDGRYKVTLALGVRSATGGQDCPGTAAAGRSFVPVTLIVANEANDKSAPFPPLRIEMTTTAAGAKPAQVLVRDPSGACTFTPKVAAIAPGGSVVFNGTSPSVDTAAAPGSAGHIQVSVSENQFALVAPLP